jgi:hypothetical protein
MGWSLSVNTHTGRGAVRTVRRMLALLPAFIVFAVNIGQAQFYYFGRNKVQYTDFSWHVLTTPHFNIYYYPEMEELAHRGAAVAEDAYAHLQQKFNHNVSGTIPLIFYSSHLHF